MHLSRTVFYGTAALYSDSDSIWTKFLSMWTWFSAGFLCWSRSPLSGSGDSFIHLSVRNISQFRSDIPAVSSLITLNAIRPAFREFPSHSVSWLGISNAFDLKTCARSDWEFLQDTRADFHITYLPTYSTRNRQQAVAPQLPAARHKECYWLLRPIFSVLFGTRPYQIQSDWRL